MGIPTDLHLAGQEPAQEPRELDRVRLAERDKPLHAAELVERLKDALTHGAGDLVRRALGTALSAIGSRSSHVNHP
jgi:hypothetical protein